MRRSGCCLGKLTKLAVWFIIIAVALAWFFFCGGKNMMLRYFYPLQHEEYVTKYSSEYKIDKYLVYAVIHTESKHDPHAVSGAGATGLMQLMEETAAWCNEEGEFGYNIPEDLTDPEANIRIGCYYLSYLLKMHNNNMETALAAYNAGEGNVKLWLEDEQYSAGDGNLKTTPYQETNDYIEKVLKSYKLYKEIY